jgi:hypothetical protein
MQVSGPFYLSVKFCANLICHGIWYGLKKRPFFRTTLSAECIGTFFIQIVSNNWFDKTKFDHLQIQWLNQTRLAKQKANK